MNNSKRLSIHLIIGLMLMTWASLAAEFVSPQQGLDVAKNWLQYWQGGENFQLREVKGYSNRQVQEMNLRTEFSDEILPELYIYYFTNGSYAVVPADDNLRPVLAYSSRPLEDAEDMPPAFKLWLDFYAQDLLSIRGTEFEHAENKRLWREVSMNNFGSMPRTRDVSPLIKTNWNQDWPYNELCPLDPAGPGGRVYVGCVATAMAQVMKYWNKPVTGQGSSSYFASGYGYQSANYGNTTYLWDEMPNSVSGSNIPVATLMYHAAVSVEMGFAPDGSGSNGMRARNALASYFRFPGSTYVQKQNYSATAWETLLRAQLDNGVPMYYSGSHTTSGHAWNCDGYQGTDYFHFNFGWSGSYNGYYYLNSITPGSNTFNLGQAAITNVIPEFYTINQPRIQLAATPPYAGDPFTVSISTYPVMGDWNVNNVSLSLFFDHFAAEYTGFDTAGTMTAGGDMQVVDNGNGYLHILWTRAAPLIGSGNLFKFNFRAIEPGNYYFGPVDMKYNNQILQNVEPLLIDIISPVASLAESRISLTNVMHLGHNQLGTMTMNTTYLPPSWNVSEVSFKANFDPAKIELTGINPEGTLIATNQNLQTTILEPGVVQVTCQTDQPISGNTLPLMKLVFRAIGNGPAAMPAVVSLSDFFYNQTQIPSTSTGIVVLAPISSVDEVVPQALTVVSCYPNPFNPSTTILLDIPISQPVEAVIYNLKGQRVFSVHSGALSAGEHRIVWNGIDDRGSALSNGVYLLRVSTASGTINKKLSLMK
jgi:hypothetical protein